MIIFRCQLLDKMIILQLDQFRIRFYGSTNLMIICDIDVFYKGLLIIKQATYKNVNNSLEYKAFKYQQKDEQGDK